MSARVFVHPRCVSNPGAGFTLQVALEHAGYDMAKTFVGPEDARGRRELVEVAWTDVTGEITFKRGDGTLFKHRPGSGTPAPAAA